MTSWRDDPELRGKLLPDHPDDLQVLVHDGEPRRTGKGPEACWVRITGAAGVLRSPVAPKGPPGPPDPSLVRWLERTIYTGQLLNQPHQLTSVAQGASVRFVHAPGMPHPVLVTPGYESERPRWAVTPCDRCGADQMLDPPSIMAKTRFPDAPPGAVPVAFSAFCPCGGTMLLAQAPDAAQGSATPQQGFGAPQQGFGAPQQGFGAPQQGFGTSGPSGGSFTPPVNAVPAAPSSNGGRTLLFAAMGCLGLVSMCCLSGVGGVFYERWSVGDAARAHAETFLGAVQRHDWASAYAASEYQSGYGGFQTTTADELARCFTGTPLFDMTSYTCSGGSSEWPMDDYTLVPCTVTTASGATTEISVGVNSPTSTPYLGFVWFSPDATVSPAWGPCAHWSGREYYQEPPPGRVRP
ncbi:MAG: hypothetical protein K1X94_12630 [Sandaracinaceae bacterium]|nr:hypothetical protein [Sandaracinaceae bacterium]